MKEYLKPGSVYEFKESPNDYPESNYTQGKMKAKTKKYHPSQAVDEYIEYFSYPGMTNLVYDEIKPEDEKIEKQLKGNRMNGNAQVDDDGKPLGNVSVSKLGEKMYKNYQDNVYGNEQMKASYKRYPTPVETAGETKVNGRLRDAKAKSKGAKVLDKLSESEVIQTEKRIVEDLQKMKKIGRVHV